MVIYGTRISCKDSFANYRLKEPILIPNRVSVPSLVGFLFRFQCYAFFFFIGSKKYKSSQYCKLKNHHTRETVATIASKLRLCIFNRSPLFLQPPLTAPRSARRSLLRLRAVLASARRNCSYDCTFSFSKHRRQRAEVTCMPAKSVQQAYA